MNNHILDWQDALAASEQICGGKGWNLARLQQAGFQIPNGFVISAELYSELLPTITADNRSQGFHQLRLPSDVLEAIQTMLQHLKLLDRPLAVRSSATLEDGSNASFAGIHESYLNVCGMRQLEQAICRCYASLWSERAVSYRRKMEIAEDQLSCAVVVSELVDAVAAGVAFSCEPQSGRRDLITVNANFGLGESVVSGVTTPDEYRIDYHQQRVVSRTLGSKHKKTVLSELGTTLVDNPDAETQSVLSDQQLAQLGRLVMRVFHTLGQSEQHQDIEWLFDGSKFWLTQARPVTSLASYTLPDMLGMKEIWSGGNFHDAIPMVLPAISSGFAGYHINNIMSHSFDGTGYSLPEGLDFGRRFEGRYYCHASLMQWLWFDVADVPPEMTNTSLGGHQESIEIDYSRHSSAAKKLKRAVRSMRFLRYVDRHKKRAEQIFQDAHQYIDEFLRQDLSALSDQQLLDLTFQVDERLSRYDALFITLTSASGSIFILIQIMEKKLGQQAYGVANALLSGGAHITSAEQGYRLFELAELLEQDQKAKEWFLSAHYQPLQWQSALPDHSIFKQAFTEYLAEYGHRAVYEIDFTRPRWQEDPSYLLNSIKSAIGKSSLNDIRAKQKSDAQQAWQLVEKTFPWLLRKIIRSMLARAISGAELREMAKSVYVRFLVPIRMLMLEFGKRLTERGLLETPDDIIHCDMSEVVSILGGEWDGHALRTVVQQRKTRQLEQEAKPAAEMIINDAVRYAPSITLAPGKGAMQGVGVAGGCVEGVARVVKAPELGGGITTGEILVAPSTDPGWTPLFLHASGLVMETGGYLSHGAIVAREYGIPAVVNVSGVMTAIDSGDQLRVNGDHGTVERVK